MTFLAVYQGKHNDVKCPRRVARPPQSHIYLRSFIAHGSFRSFSVFCFHKSEIGRMDALEYLRFNENLLARRAMPSELGLLWNLKELNLASTGMGGFLPSELSLLTGLERLELGENNFRGTLATEIGLLTNLCKYCLYDSFSSVAGFERNRSETRRQPRVSQIPFLTAQLLTFVFFWHTYPVLLAYLLL